MNTWKLIFAEERKNDFSDIKNKIEDNTGKTSKTNGTDRLQTHTEKKENTITRSQCVETSMGKWWFYTERKEIKNSKIHEAEAILLEDILTDPLDDESVRRPNGVMTLFRFLYRVMSLKRGHRLTKKRGWSRRSDWDSDQVILAVARQDWVL